MEHPESGVSADDTHVAVEFPLQRDPEDREVVVRDPRPEPDEPEQPDADECDAGADRDQSRCE